MQRLLILIILKKSEWFIFNISKAASFITPTASKSKPEEGNGVGKGSFILLEY